LVLRDGILFEDSTSTIPFTGRNKSKMLTQSIEYDVVNGLKNGDFIIYYPDGKIQMIGRIKQNKNTGLWKYYYSNGALESEGYFNNDIPDSVWTWYNKNGKVLQSGNFVDGKRNGEWKGYDSVGNLISLKSYINDKLVDSTKLNE